MCLFCVCVFSVCWSAFINVILFFVFFFICFFFCQAEDGIRDLVRSRGLGDVYKRQGVAQSGPDVVREVVGVDGDAVTTDARPGIERLEAERLGLGPVSYTHLTLPTSDLV